MVTPIKPRGPVPCDLMVIGEAPGANEDALGAPFMGASGKELERMLADAGIDPRSVRYTNVFMTRPPNNKVEAFCGKRSEVPKDYPHPPLSSGNWVLMEHLHVLERLAEEIAEAKPKLVVAVGNVPCWALLGRTGVTKLRGTVFPSARYGVPVIPTFHPAFVLRDWSNRTIVVSDLIKAARHLEGTVEVPRRELWLQPTLAEVEYFCNQFIFGDRPRLLSLDIETFGGTITCIGFAPSRERAITIPFYDPGKLDRNYWSSQEEEVRAWSIVKSVCESDIPKLGQNGLYDIQYLARWGIRVQRYLEDTMLRHHALYPEMPKSLGFMASKYTDEANWKVLRDRNRDNFKLEDDL